MVRIGLVAAAVLAIAGPALADEGKTSLRLVGEATGAMPHRFVIDGWIEGEAGFERTVEGWAAGLAEGDGSGEVSGSCVENTCALTLNFEAGEVKLSADITGARPGRWKMESDMEGKAQSGTVTLKPFSGPAPEVGELAPPGSISGSALADLLAWNGASVGFSNARSDDPPDGFELSSLAEWQMAGGRPGTGLLTAADLKALKDGAAAAKSKAGWTPVKGKGWEAGYPAALLPKMVSSAGGERTTYSSADGKAWLTLAVEPPMTDDAWDAYVDEQTAEHEGRESLGYTRVNDDMQQNYQEKGATVLVLTRRREGAVVKLTYSYDAETEAYLPWADIFPRAFSAGDEARR